MKHYVQYVHIHNNTGVVELFNEDTAEHWVSILGQQKSFGPSVRGWSRVIYSLPLRTECYEMLHRISDLEDALERTSQEKVDVIFG